MSTDQTTVTNDDDNDLVVDGQDDEDITPAARPEVRAVTRIRLPVRPR